MVDCKDGQKTELRYGGRRPHRLNILPLIGARDIRLISVRNLSLRYGCPRLPLP